MGKPFLNAFRCVLVPLAASFVFLAPQARAQGEDKAAADALFEQGRGLLAKGDLAHACPKLEESLRLDRGIGTMLYLAECYQREGKTASAWAEFREAEDLAAKENDGRRSVAQERAQRLAPSLSYMTVRVDKPTPGLLVARDGREIGAPGWGTETPIDPGEHTISATAPNRAAWQVKVKIEASGDHRTVSVPELAPALVAGPVDDRKEVTVARTWQRVLGAGMFVAGVVGVGIGTGFGVSAISNNNKANDHCPVNGCDSQGLAFGHTANQQGNISTVAFIAGGVFIVGGAIVYLTAKHTIRARAEALLVSVAVGDAGAEGLALHF